MNNSPSPAPPGDASPILLVDDDATNLDILRQTLGSASYRLFVARNGEEAVKVARRAHPLVILLDVVMPGIDGYETCRRLKDDPETRDAAVIFLSALTDPKDKVRGFEAGAVDFVTKPFEGNEIVARVNTHLAIQRLLHRPADARSPTTPHDGTVDLPGGVPAVTRGPEETVFRTGDVVAFRFRIVRYLARGGMGELYEAEDLELRERVALKTILSTIAEDERSVLRFKREVHLARQVTHPNVCRIYDVFRHRPSGAGHAREVVFLAMELLRGEMLADKLHRDGRFQTTDLLPLARQMAAGLAAAHQVGVVHRDFKPQNVILVKRDPPEETRAVVTDFGLARRSTVGDTTTAFSLSFDGAGQICGTPAYMAPEQVEGSEVTPATDVYAFGVVLYELLTGARPFEADTPVGTAIKRLQQPPPSPKTHVPDLDPRWEATILRCLARQPADRFANVGDVVASLESTHVEKSAADRRPPRSRAFGAWLIVALISLAVLAGGYAWYRTDVAPPGVTSVAVLPFENTSNDREQEFLSDGISEGLINRLSQLDRVKVVANSSSSRYKGKDADPRDVARALGVTAILAGKVSQRGDSLAISVELIEGRDRTHMWGEQYVRKMADLSRVPAEISRDVAEQLHLRLTASEQRRIATSEIGNAKAYELLLRGHFHRAKGATEDRQKASEYFQQAIDADPTYALAYADLSDIQRSLINSGHLDPKIYLPRARESAMKALELDESLADGHFALANLLTYGWEWTVAEREYTRAIALNPNHALAHRWYAAYLRLMRRHDEAITQILRARELDPLSPGVNATVGWVLTSAGRYDQASEALKKALELDRTYPYTHLFLGHLHAAQKDYVEAIGAYRQAATLGLDTPSTRIRLGAAQAYAGQADRARAILKELQTGQEHVSSGELAILFAALGDREQAFASLEEAYRAHDLHLQHLGVDPGFDQLRADPRFQDLLRRVGLRR